MMEEQALDILERCEIATAVKVHKKALLLSFVYTRLKMLPELCMLLELFPRCQIKGYNN